jgi:hypothetical protein
MQSDQDALIEFVKISVPGFEVAASGRFSAGPKKKRGDCSPLPLSFE